MPRAARIVHPFRMFDRMTVGHPWEGAFTGCAALDPAAGFQNLSWRTVCANWTVDHRVHRDREAVMRARSEFLGAATPEEWREGCRKHFRNTLCLPAETLPGLAYSAYRHPFNENNRLPPDTMAASDQLIHVGSVTAMLWRLAKKSDAETDDEILVRAFQARFGLRLPLTKEWPRFVEETSTLCHDIAEMGEARIRDLAAFLAENLGNTQPPWWACLGREIAPRIKRRDWTGVCRALGLGHLEKGERLMLWRYPVAVAGPLFRPTVVEANDSPYHFPSPPTGRLGVAMHLDASAPNYLHEVVHAPLDPDDARRHCLASAGLGIVEEEPISDHSTTLPGLRDRHREKLEAGFAGPRDLTWIASIP